MSHSPRDESGAHNSTAKMLSRRKLRFMRTGPLQTGCEIDSWQRFLALANDNANAR